MWTESQVRILVKMPSEGCMQAMDTDQKRLIRAMHRDGWVAVQGDRFKFLGGGKQIQVAARTGLSIGRGFGI